MIPNVDRKETGYNTQDLSECEICGGRDVCVEEYGVTACPECRYDLLP